MKENEKIGGAVEKVGNDGVYKILTGDEVGWQAIIYDLINTEQLDPWDIDLILLSSKYLEKIREIEEANFFVSSRVLLAASLLLRIKSEILMEKYIRSLDEILFGKKEEEKKEIERIEFDESEIPVLYPKTPLPRYRQVTLNELMTALNKAIDTEGRRIKKEVVARQMERDADIVIPKTRVSVRDRMRRIHSKILTIFKKKQEKIAYSELVGGDRDEKVACFLPTLHLDHQQKLFLHQEEHFEEIWIWLYKYKPEELERAIVEELEEEGEKE